jgi:hypothetical protein
MRINWTEKMVKKLIKLYPSKSNRELIEIFKVSKVAIISKANKLGIKKNKRSKNWSASEIEDLKKLYPDTDNLYLVSYFDRPLNSIYHKANIMNIKKSDEYIAKAKIEWGKHVIEVGKEYRFKKGMNTWNKGIKGYMGPNSTSFKKGLIPKNVLPVGSERIDKDGYTLVKILEPNVWELKHRIVWKERFGEIPDKHAVIFINGDKSNFDISNLVLVHRRQLLYFNRHGKYPADIMEAQKLIIQLQNLIKDNAKEQN